MTMRMRRAAAVAVLGGVLALAGCDRDDTHGDVSGHQERAIPAGAIPAPTEGNLPSIPGPAPTGDPVTAADSGVAPATAPLDTASAGAT